jgi:hypothetical protein
MAKEDFIPVTGDDWYERRRDDAEGIFFRGVADQGPRKGEGGSTRQGIYLLTADGKLLAYKNSQDASVMREVLATGLKEWKKLPPDHRKPGAVKVEDLDKPDARYTRTLPEGGLILTVYTRILDTKEQDILCKGNCDTPGGDRAARDHLWLTKGEWQSLIPAKPAKGDSFAVPEAVADRILRFHLIDNTRGEPPMWTAKEIRSKRLTLRVEKADDNGVHLRLEGSALLATHEDPAKADRGFDARMLGDVHYNAGKKTIDRFDLAVLGDHWGAGTFTGGARPGRKPLGLFFEIAEGKTAAERVPPQGAREWNAYMGRNR